MKYDLDSKKKKKKHNANQVNETLYWQGKIMKFL